MLQAIEIRTITIACLVSPGNNIIVIAIHKQATFYSFKNNEFVFMVTIAVFMSFCSVFDYSNMFLKMVGVCEIHQTYKMQLQNCGFVSNRLELAS